MFNLQTKEIDATRQQAVKDLMLLLIKEGNLSDLLRVDVYLVGVCFPNIHQFIETEKDGFVELLKNVAVSNPKLLVAILQEQTHLLDLIKYYLTENRFVVEEMLKWIIQQERGGPVLDALIRNELLVDLDKSWLKQGRNIAAVKLFLKSCDIDYTDRFGNVLSQNLDVDNCDIVEYLIKKGASIERGLSCARLIKHRSLKVILKMKGNGFIERIPLSLLLPNVLDSYEGLYEMCYENVKVLKRLKFSIPANFVGERTLPQCVVALMSFGYVKYEELNDRKQDEVALWIKKNNVKVDVVMLPFLCKEIKQRMWMFLLCVNRSVGFVGKDLRMLLLDSIWSLSSFE